MLLQNNILKIFDIIIGECFWIVNKYYDAIMNKDYKNATKCLNEFKSISGDKELAEKLSQMINKSMNSRK